MRSLALLYLFLLSGMLLFELLRLLGVALFHLLFLRVIVILLGCLLVFIFLLLLELLVILRLLGSQLGLLLLIFVVSCGVASVRRRKLVLLQFASVTVSVCRGSSVICRMIFRAWASFIPRMRFIATCGIGRRSLICASGLSRRYNASFEVSWFRGSCDRRFALVRGGT